MGWRRIGQGGKKEFTKLFKDNPDKTQLLRAIFPPDCFYDVPNVTNADFEAMQLAAKGVAGKKLKCYYQAQVKRFIALISVKLNFKVRN